MSAASSSLERPIAELLPAASKLLHRLGITENYKGFRYAAYAASLCVLEQDRLLLVTKLLYPDVARYFGTTWQSVERDLRTVVNIAWTHNGTYLADLSGGPLEQKPHCAQFIAILSYALQSLA